MLGLKSIHVSKRGPFSVMRCLVQQRHIAIHSWIDSIWIIEVLSLSWRGTSCLPRNHRSQKLGPSQCRWVLELQCNWWTIKYTFLKQISNINFCTALYLYSTPLSTHCALLKVFNVNSKPSVFSQIFITDTTEFAHEGAIWGVSHEQKLFMTSLNFNNCSVVTLERVITACLFPW